MKHSIVPAVIVALFAAAMPCFGQANACSPVGTWFGGSDMTHPYQMTIVPTGGDRYSLRFQQALDYRSLGILGVTDWTGEMIKGPGRKYEVQLVVFYWQSPEASLNGEPLDMEAARSTIEFGDNCNVIQHTITTFISYLPWTEEKVPFVTPPDYDYIQMFLGGQPLVEKYHRMPTACPICPAALKSK